MKVVLVVLSGGVQQALDSLAVLYPKSSLELILRSEFETGSSMTRLSALRARRPDVFAIATESLPWQRGQDLFMLFGAMAGAREVVMIRCARAVTKRFPQLANCAGPDAAGTRSCKKCEGNDACSRRISTSRKGS